MNFSLRSRSVHFRQYVYSCCRSLIYRSSLPFCLPHPELSKGFSCYGLLYQKLPLKQAAPPVSSQIYHPTVDFIVPIKPRALYGGSVLGRCSGSIVQTEANRALQFATVSPWWYLLIILLFTRLIYRPTFSKVKSKRIEGRNSTHSVLFLISTFHIFSLEIVFRPV